MKSIAHDTATALAVAFALVLAAAPAFANDPQPLTFRTKPADTGERTYFFSEVATIEDAVDLRDRLIEAGAWNVNLFVQERVIVCGLTPQAAAAIEIPAGFRVEPAGVAGRRLRLASESWGWIAEAYERADRGQAAHVPSGEGEAPVEALDDVVLAIPPEQVREVQRAVERSMALRGVEPKAQPARAVNQNSEVMGGSILATFIFPESDGTRDTDTQNWSDDDMREALIGAAGAFLAWQSAWSQMDISTTFNMLERVPTGYEPIKHDMGTDALWIVDVMRNLGWGLHSDNTVAVVHEFNEEMRALYRTRWVVTSFIACSRNVFNHRFGNGTANYTAYAFLGGPYMVEPFPAGLDPNNIGETLVYSKIVQHEVGHLFWTLDEYPNAPGTCSTTSGYLNYGNANITLVGPAGEARCEPHVPCIMHSAPRVGQDRPWCRYSLGHFGVVDDNNNGYPDIFEAEPEIVFQPEGPETVTTNQFTLRFRAVARAVPNRNVYQNPDLRVDYAAPLREVRLSLGQGASVSLTPVDGRMDGLEEEFVLPMSLAQVGQSAVVIRARNAVGYQSRAFTKEVYFTGVNYTRVGATPKLDRIDVTWETAGEIFGAKFDVYKLRPGEALPGTRINEGPVSPSGPGNAGFVPYRLIDWDVVPGEVYRYYVEGSFALPFEGGTKEYRSRSDVVGQTAAIPIVSGELVSDIAPNPSNGNVILSVQVPRTYGGDPRAPIRLATPVEVAVYDVRGRRIRELESRPRFDDVLTLRWDGRNDANVPVPAGVYFVRVNAGGSKTVRKLVLLH